MKDKKSKSVFKALTWRIIATLTTVSIVFFLTGKVNWALEIGSLDFIVKLILYYVHERMWTIPYKDL